MGGFSTLALLLSLPACDDSIGPRLASVEGVWDYTATVSFNDRDCVVSGVVLSLLQEEGIISGTVQEGTVTCTPGSSEPTSFSEISSGTIIGDFVSFNLGGDDFRHSGALSDSGVTGNVEVFLDDEAGEGSFEMHRR